MTDSSSTEMYAAEETPAARDESREDPVSPRFFRWSMTLVLAYFAVRLIYLAAAVSPNVPPDEVTHAGLCGIFSRVLLLPENSPATYEFGLVTNTRWLYYWVMGKLLHLNIFGISDLLFLRLLNIPLAFGTVYFVWRLLRLLTEDRLSQLLLLIVMTNTPMFSLLSASVSYDNLANLLAAMSIYYMLAFFREGRGGLLAASVLSQLAGGLTKTAFLPLALVLELLLLVHLCRNLREYPAMLKAFFRPRELRPWLAAFAVVSGIALNLTLYGGNYLRFGTPSPVMSYVVPAEKAMENRIAARETIFSRYVEGEITYLEALQLAGEIRHPGDKADTFFLLMNYENLKKDPSLWMSFPEYAKVWLRTVGGTVFGIKAHQIMTKEERYLLPLYLLLAAGVAGFVVRWRPSTCGWLPPCMACIALFYGAFFLYKVNYTSYLFYGTPGPTLQGRYLFPVIGPVYVFVFFYLVRLFRSDIVRIGIAAGTATLFVLYDFPWFLMHAGPKWYA